MPDQNWFAQSRAPLLAIELQYYRVPRDDWELMLARHRQMGANTISTYIFWGWHEYAEGCFDFNGETLPERDIVGFIRLCQEMGFTMLVKPGPFIDAEVLGGGIPSWLLAGHPEIYALRNDGQPWRHSDSGQPRCCYLHPLYLEYVQKWYARLSQEISAFQWPAGPIIAVQVDNETPGDGMIAGDVEETGFDYHFRGDYNPYITETVWPHWLEERYGDPGKLSQAYAQPVAGFSQVPFPAQWTDPQGLGDLRLWMDAARFTDWYFSQGLRVYSQMLRQLGWHAPLFQDLLCMPWEASGILVDMGGFAEATGWLGHNLYTEYVREPFVQYGYYQMGFEEYVQYAFWRTRLMKSYAPQYPAFIPEISAAGDFFLQSPFVGGLEAISIYVGSQSNPEPPLVGAFPRWAMEAPIRLDGSLRRRFWNAKTLLTYLDAGGKSFAQSIPPSDLILGYTHVPELAWQWSYALPPELESGNNPFASRMKNVSGLLPGADSSPSSQRIAQELVRQGVDFSVLDIDHASLDQLLPPGQPAPLLVMPASLVLSRKAQSLLSQFLKAGGKLLWVDMGHPAYDENIQDYTELIKTIDQTRGFQRISYTSVNWRRIIQEAGKQASYAWVEGEAEGIDVTVRHGPGDTAFLAIANRTPNTFEGTIAYLDVQGRTHKVEVRLAGPHAHFISLQDGNLLSASFFGEQGGAYIRSAGRRLSIDRGQIVVADYEGALLVSSPESIQLTLENNQPWPTLAAWRLLVDGGVKPARVEITGQKLQMYYKSEEEIRETEACLLIPSNAMLPAGLQPPFRTRLAQRILYLERAAQSAHALQAKTSESAPAGFEGLTRILQSVEHDLKLMSGQIRHFSQGDFSVEAYIDVNQQAYQAIQPAVLQAVDLIRRLRADLSAGLLPAALLRTGQSWIEEGMTRLLRLLERSELWQD